jgi:DNA-directed RNA polymerase specialized sigma24 family protein
MDTQLLELASQLSTRIANRFRLEPNELLSEFYTTACQRIEPSAAEQMSKRSLIVILHNCARDILRREPGQRFRRAAARRNRGGGPPENDYVTPAILSLSEIPDSEDSLQERPIPSLAVWEEILSSIPQADRHVIHLKFVCDMSWPEIATETGREPEQVKSSFKRQKLFLKQYFQEALS